MKQTRIMKRCLRKGNWKSLIYYFHNYTVQLKTEINLVNFARKC